MSAIYNNINILICQTSEKPFHWTIPSNQLGLVVQRRGNVNLRGIINQWQWLLKKTLFVQHFHFGYSGAVTLSNFRFNVDLITQVIQ